MVRAPKPIPPAGEAAKSNGLAAVFGSIGSEFSKRLVTIIVTVVLTASASAAAFAWTFVNTFIDERIVDTVVAGLTQPDSKLSVELDRHASLKLSTEGTELQQKASAFITQAIEASFDSKVGALSAGRVVLTRTAPSETIYVYSPEGHTVKLLLRVRNLGDGESVSIIRHNGSARTVTEEGYFDIDVSGTQTSSANDLAIEDVVSPLSGAFRDLQALRIQLAATRASSTATPDVEYLAIVTPAITMAE